jgi:hypothetical protein
MHVLGDMLGGPGAAKKAKIIKIWNCCGKQHWQTNLNTNGRGARCVCGVMQHAMGRCISLHENHLTYGCGSEHTPLQRSGICCIQEHQLAEDPQDEDQQAFAHMSQQATMTRLGKTSDRVQLIIFDSL